MRRPLRCRWAVRGGGGGVDWLTGFPRRGQSLPKCDGGGVAEATGPWAWREMTFPLQVMIKEGPEEPEAG